MISEFVFMVFAFFVGVIATFDVDPPPIEHQMVRGERVALGSAPFMASLRSLQNVHYCGGVIVSNRYVLTTRTCTGNHAASAINILVGTNLRNSGGITYRGSTKIDHHDYNPETMANDISLIRTSATIAITPNIQVAVLNSYLHDNEVPVATYGWGMVSVPEYDSNYMSRISTTTKCVHPSIRPQPLDRMCQLLRESIFLDNAIIEDHSLILHAIVGRKARIGCWSRVEGTPSDPDPNKPFAKMENPPLFDQNGKFNPSITILGSCVIVPSEKILLNCIILQDKCLSRSFKNEIIL